MLAVAFWSGLKKITTAMGCAVSYFRKKKSSLEELQEIEETTKNIEEYNKNVERRYKTVVRLLFYTGVLLVLFGFLYLYFVPLRSFKERCIYGGILLVLSLILIFLRRIMSWYYNRKISSNRRKLNEIDSLKKKIIKDVMEKETYNVAKEILEKYAPSTVFPRMSTSVIPLTSRNQAGNELRQRSVVPSPPRVVALQPLSSQPALSRQVRPQGQFPPIAVPTSPGRSSILDRMAEFVLGDGAPGRYALICTRCHTHNGLALPEEFPYLSFRCMSCREINRARKHRPQAPRLETSSETTDVAGVSETAAIAESENSQGPETLAEADQPPPVPTESSSVAENCSQDPPPAESEAGGTNQESTKEIVDVKETGLAEDSECNTGEESTEE